MENEQNRGLVNKKAYEDQWAGLVSITFCHFSFWSSLINFSLSLLDTQSFLGAILEGVAYLMFWRKKAKEDHESARGH